MADPTTEPAAPPRRRRWLAGLAALAVSAGAWAVVVLTAPRDDPPPKAPTYPVFAPDNVFALDVTSAPVDASSPAMMGRLRSDITNRYGGVAALNTQSYGMSLAVATDSTPRVTVRFDNCQRKPATPTGLYDGPAYFVDVPVPTDAVAAAGTDGQLSVWSPATDRLWEFWRARRGDDGTWSACWGGRIDGVTASRGQFPVPYGASASGLASVGSALTLADARRGRVDHALGLGVPRPAAQANGRGVWWPAVRSDGTDAAPDALPLGARLRLDPDLEVDDLPLTPVGKAVARAAQRYGFVVVDTSGAVAVVAESGASERADTGTDPWPGVLGGPAYEQLKGFPWDRVVVLQRDWGKPPTRR